MHTITKPSVLSSPLQDKAPETSIQQQPQAMSLPKVEILDHAPTVMRKALALIDGRGYAALWPHIQITTPEELNDEGTIIKHNPPKVKTVQSLRIVRDDGRTFGHYCDEPLENLGFEVCLPEVLPTDKLWSVAAMKAYCKGTRSSPPEVFERICQVVDRFIDFDKSVSDQRAMCEFIACYIMSTWFMESFTVAGFLWPNGERGSGKTQLLALVAQLGYLGQLLLAGSSYAALRDLAEQGGHAVF